MTIYADLIILENLFLNYLILFTVAKVLKGKVKNIRMVISALIGAVYAIVMLIPNAHVYQTIICKILLSCIMIIIAFWPKTLKSFLVKLSFFYLISFVFGGTTLALLFLIEPNNISVKNGMFIGYYPLKVVFLGAICGFLIIVQSLKNVKGKLKSKDIICNINITIFEQKASINAVIDTGNMLKDPITNIPVIVVELEKIAEILPSEIVQIVKTDEVEQNLNYEYINKIRMIPFSSLGKQHGMITAVRADNVQITYDEEQILIEDAFVGIYTGKLSKKDEYSGLIGLNLLEHKTAVIMN